MSKQVLNASFLKYQLMKYFRYDKQYIFVCSEAINRSDISAIDSKNLVEVEIKLTKQDFLREFSGDSKNKSRKHRIYNAIYNKKKPRQPKNYITPNYFMFCVTQNIKDFVIDYINKNNLPYGVLLCDSKRVYGQKSNITCIKKAKKIHSNTPLKEVFYKIGKRVQSELINLKRKEFENGK